MHKTLSNFDNSITYCGKNSEIDYANSILRGRYAYEREDWQVPKIDASVIQENLYGEKGPFLFHIYEGNLQSLYLASLLLIKNPTSLALVNMHWADQASVQFSNKDFKSKIFYTALSKLSNYFEGRLILAAESKKLATLMSEKLNIEVIEYLVFSVHDKNNEISNEKEFTVLASPCGLNEFHQIIDTTLDFLKRDQKVAINIPVHLLSSEIEESEISNAKNLGFTIYTANLDRDSYKALGTNARVTILTYTNKFYEWGSSGKLLDSVRFGARVIVPDNCAMAESVLRNKWGSTYSPNNLASLEWAITHELINNESAKEIKTSPGIEDFKNFLGTLIINYDEFNKNYSQSIGFLKKISVKINIYIFKVFAERIWLS